MRKLIFLFLAFGFVLAGCSSSAPADGNAIEYKVKPPSDSAAGATSNTRPGDDTK